MSVNFTGTGITMTAGGRRNTARLQILASQLPQRARRVARVHAELVRTYAISFAPEYHPPEGEPRPRRMRHDQTIKQAIKVVPLDAGGLRFAITADTPQAAPQEFGARPHQIRPTVVYQLQHGGDGLQLRNIGKPLLVFYSPQRGSLVQKKVVNHPGNKPQPFMGPARRRVAATFYVELRRMFTDLGVPWQAMK